MTVPLPPKSLCTGSDHPKKDLLAFPEEVIDDIGYALGVVQLGGTPPSAKPWKGEGPGVLRHK
jgi:phage-related protein